MPKLSIVSPVYNVGPYLPGFLASLSKQTFQDFEIIFVYDESMDDSLSLIERFKALEGNKDRVQILVNEEKRGAGFAKDFGFSKASKESDYVLFLDSDDRFSDSFFEKLITKADATGADITICGYNRVNGKDGSLICEEMVSNPNELVDLADLQFPLYLINTAAWNKLYRRKVAEQCQFGEAKHAEDLYYLLQAIRSSTSVAFINEPLYEYLIHEGSLINTLSYAKYLDVLNRFLVFSKCSDNPEIADLISAFIFLRIGIGTTLRICQSGEKKNREIIKETKQYLKTNFNVFGKNKYLSLSFMRRAGMKGRAIWVCKVLYKMGLFGIAVRYYIHRAKRTNKEIRW